MKSTALFSLLFVFSAFTDGPDLNAIHPVGAPRGSTNTVTLSGKFDPWPPKFWSDPPGLVFKPETNKNKVVIEIPNDVAPGPRLVRVYNSDGQSDPKFFVVGQGREVFEKEPNGRASEAQDPGPLPVTINGKLDKGDDVDAFKISLTAGQWLDASMESFTLMSKVDGVLRLITTNGVTLAWNHDYATFDPHLWWQAPSNQTVILQVFGFAYPANSEIKLTGGDEAFYRLRLETNPPPAWKNSSNDLTAIAGTIDVVGKEDRYLFSAKKDQYYEFRVTAAGVGSPLDAWLKIRDAAGAGIEHIDDSEGSQYPRLEWKPPATTNFFFCVGSTLHRAGPDFHYLASVRELEPDFTATWKANALELKAGETNALKFELKRLRGYTNELLASIRNLPKGVQVSLTNSLSKAGEISFPIVASTNAPPSQGSIELHLVDQIRKIDRPVVFELISRGENNGVPNGYSTLAINSLSNIWLTVKTNKLAK